MTNSPREIREAVAAGFTVQWRWKGLISSGWVDWAGKEIPFDGKRFHHSEWRIKPPSLFELAETSYKVFDSIRRIQERIYFHPDPEMQQAVGNLWVAVNNYGNICRK